MPATALSFVAAGKTIIGNGRGHSLTVFKRRFGAHFGVTPEVSVSVWNKPFHRVSQRFEQKHLPWGLLLLKCYHTEHVNATLTGVDEKIFRWWSWTAVQELANLGFIEWTGHLDVRAANVAYTYVDSTDFRIEEPTPFDSCWYSFKFHGARLHYEVGVCIDTGYIVWLHGPFPCGIYNDLRILRKELKCTVVPNRKWWRIEGILVKIV